MKYLSLFILLCCNPSQASAQKVLALVGNCGNFAVDKIISIDLNTCDTSNHCFLLDYNPNELCYTPNGKLYMTEYYSIFSIDTSKCETDTSHVLSLGYNNNFVLSDKSGHIFFGVDSLRSFDPISKQLINYGALPFDSDITRYYSDNVFINNELYGFMGLYKVWVRIDLADPSVANIIGNVTINNTNDPVLALASIPINCDSTLVFMGMRKGKIYRLNFPSLTTTLICDTKCDVVGLTSMEEFNPQTAKCDLYIDLDADDSAGLDGFDHPDSIYCALTQSTICDITDAKVFAEGKIDSIRINISGNLNTPNEYLTFPPSSNISVVTISPSHLLLVNSGSASNGDYTQFIRGMRYQIDGNRISGNRQIKFRIFAYGDSSIPAICKLRIDPLIWAGDDNAIQVCQKSPLLDLNTYANGIPGGTWSFNNGFFDPTSDASQVVSYIVTHPKCPADSAFFNITLVPVPVLMLPVDSAICSNINFVPFNIIASGSNIMALSWQDGSTANSYLVNSFGTYSVIASNGVACADTASFTLTNLPIPVASIIGDPLICPLESTLLTASSSNTYLWTNGSSNASILVDKPGLYAVTLTNSFNCSDSASVFITLAPPIIVDPFIISPLCLGDNNGQLVALDITSGAQPLTWQLFDELGILADPKALKSGAYLLILTDSEACKDSLNIDIPLGSALSIDLGQDLTLNQGESAVIMPIVLLGNPIQYDWTPIDYFDSIAFDIANFTATQSTTIGIVATDINGCKASDNINVKVDSQVKIYVPNVFSPNGDGNNDRFGIYADPAIWTIEYLEIFGRWGQQVFRTADIPANNPSLGWDGTVNNKPADDGVYVWHAQIRNINGTVQILAGEVMVVR